MRKGIVSYIFSMLLLFSATILANDFGVVESGGESLAQSTNMSLRFYNQIQTAGHIEFVARVIGDSDLEPQGPYTYFWSIEGYPESATMYIWPSGGGQGSTADVSIYYSSSGSATVKCEVYENGVYLRTLYGSVSF